MGVLCGRSASALTGSAVRPLSITVSLYHTCIYLSRVFAKLFQDFLQPCPVSLALIVPGVVCTRGGLRRAQRAGGECLNHTRKIKRAFFT